MTQPLKSNSICFYNRKHWSPSKLDFLHFSDILASGWEVHRLELSWLEQPGVNSCLRKSPEENWHGATVYCVQTSYRVMIQIFRSIHTLRAGGLTAVSKTECEPDGLHKIQSRDRTLPQGPTEVDSAITWEKKTARSAHCMDFDSDINPIGPRGKTKALG